MTHLKENPEDRPGSRETSPSQGPVSAEDLMKDFNQALVRMLQLRLGSHEDAREIAQEAYAKLLVVGNDEEALTAFAARGGFKALLIKSLLLVILAVLNSRKAGQAGIQCL